MPDQSAPANSNRVSFSLDLRFVVIFLALVIAGMLAIWKPWNSPAKGDRTVEVTGTATLKAEPDEFIFYPSYELKNNDRVTALNELSKKSDELVAKLKSLGVQDKDIKTNSSDYARFYYPANDGSQNTYTLQLTITAHTRDQAQKVQDYLVTTAPTGTVSPQANFSSSKRKELENKARDEASKDARAKAEQSAKNLGFKIGKVKSVSDGSGFGGIYPMMDKGVAADAMSSSPRLSVQPGENELDYTVTVTYYLR
jgi:uncharacterized protein YggE